MIKPRTARKPAVILTEACVSLALVGVVLAVASLLVTQHARAADYYVNLRRAQLAAESCLERMRGGLLDVVDSTFTDEGGIAYEIRVAKADASWQPLQRIHVRAIITKDQRRPTCYETWAYVRPSRNHL